MPRQKIQKTITAENSPEKNEVLSFTLSPTEKAHLLRQKKNNQTLSGFLRDRLLDASPEAKLLSQLSGVGYRLDQLQERVAKMEELVTKTTTHHTHLMTQVVEIFKRVESNLANIAATQASDDHDLRTVVQGVNDLVRTLAEERVAVTTQINNLTVNLQELLGLLSGGGGSHAPGHGQMKTQSPGAGPGGP